MSNTELQVASATRSMERRETFAPRNLSEAFQFADMVLESGMAPKSYLDIYEKGIKEGLTREQAGQKARSAVVVAIQFGLEVGFPPMQALQSIANINGTPSVWGDGALALVQSSGLLEWIKEDNLEAVKAAKKATCKLKRRSDPEVKEVTFSYDDADKAGINKRGVWLTYPHRMCMMRARAFALRDKFPDVLKGLRIAEEVMDYTEPESSPEPPKIQATVVIPSAVKHAPEEEPIQDAEVVNDAEEKIEEDPVISKEEAVLYYRAYSANGKLPEESKSFLKASFGSENSLAIKRKDYAAAMEWAKSPRVVPEQSTASGPTEVWNGTLPMED